MVVVSIDPAHERREFPRIRLKAFGFEHQAEFMFDGKIHRVSLVDVSPGGARLGRMGDDQGCAAKRGDILNIKLLLKTSQDILPNAIPCIIRWRANNEMGVQFQPQLDVSVGELQKLLVS